MIGLFVPEKTELVELNIDRFSDHVGKKVMFSYRGRYAIKRIVEAFLQADPENRKGVLMPAYMCDSVYEQVRTQGANVYFADIDISDLNISCASVSSILENNKDILCVIVPSLYGNPADILSIGKICADHNVALIDDAAQAWGAKLDGKLIGTFGNAGVWACSPGKPTGGHAGALFWCDKDITSQLKKHTLLHHLIYSSYRRCRRDVYTGSPLSNRIGRFESRLASLIGRFVKTDDDDRSDFEDELIGGYFWDSVKFADKRRMIHEHFAGKYGDAKGFRIIRSQRGESHSCKIVLLFDDSGECTRVKDGLTKQDIRWFGGYGSLDPDHTGLDVTKKIKDCVIELPIELNDAHMKEIEDALDKLCQKG